MIYTPLTIKALKISFSAHKNQVDKAGVPYVYHPYEVASHMDGEYETVVALLHDTVEDTDITLAYLEREGFPKDVTDAISLLTHDKNVPYMEYITKIKSNEIAAKVKIADLRHNMDVTRNPGEPNTKLELYSKALSYLEKATPDQKGKVRGSK